MTLSSLWGCLPAWHATYCRACRRHAVHHTNCVFLLSCFFEQLDVITVLNAWPQARNAEDIRTLVVA